MRAAGAVILLLAAAGCSGSFSSPTPTSSAEPGPTPTGTPLDCDLPDDEEAYPEWALATRYDKLALVYRDGVVLAAIPTWLKP